MTCTWFWSCRGNTTSITSDAIIQEHWIVFCRWDDILKNFPFFSALLFFEWMGTTEGTLLDTIISTLRMAWQLFGSIINCLHKICALSALLFTDHLLCAVLEGLLMLIFNDFCPIWNQWCPWNVQQWPRLWSPYSWCSKFNVSGVDSPTRCLNLMLAHCSSFKINNFDGEFP